MNVLKNMDKNMSVVQIWWNKNRARTALKQRKATENAAHRERISGRVSWIRTSLSVSALVRLALTFWTLELYLETFHADLEAVHGLDGCL